METIRVVRRLVLAGVGSLTVLCAVGAGVFSLVEEVGYLEGLWLAFSVVSTTGFGQGPATPAGMVTSMVLFVLALPAYVTLGAAAIVMAQELNPARTRSPRPMLVERDVRRVVDDLNRN